MKRNDTPRASFAQSWTIPVKMGSTDVSSALFGAPPKRMVPQTTGRFRSADCRPDLVGGTPSRATGTVTVPTLVGQSCLSSSLALLLILCCSFFGTFSLAAANKKVMVLGIDGMD